MLSFVGGTSGAHRGHMRVWPRGPGARTDRPRGRGLAANQVSYPDNKHVLGERGALNLCRNRGRRRPERVRSRGYSGCSNRDPASRDSYRGRHHTGPHTAVSSLRSCRLPCRLRLCVRTFCTVSRRPHGAARAAASAPRLSLSLPLSRRRANAGRLARRRETFGPPLTDSSYRQLSREVSMLPLRNCPRPVRTRQGRP